MRRIVGLVVLAGLLAAGCATSRLVSDRRAVTNRVPLGRVLVVGRSPVEANRAVAETAADLLVRHLRGSGDVRGVTEFLAEAGTAGLAAVAPRVVDAVRGGGSPLAVDPDGVLERLKIWTVVVVDVTPYEQVWGRYGKFTRVGVEAEAVHLPSRQSLWRVHGGVEIEEMRGRSFRYALEQAVTSVADAIRPGASTTALGEFLKERRR